MKKYVCVYGSLRPGCYNYEHFRRYYTGEIKPVLEAVIMGYDLYSLGSYPGIKEGKGTLRVDVLEVSEECYQAIDSMELGAGYSRKIIDIEGKECTIYLYDYDVDNKDLVESGDWLKYSTKKELA